MSLNSLDLKYWNVSNVENLSHCFSNCTELRNLDLRHWDTSSVRDMNNCFSGCTSLTYLNIENWVIDEMCDIEDMFKGCDNLSVIKCRRNVFERIKNEEWSYENGYARRMGAMNIPDDDDDEMIECFTINFDIDANYIELY